MLDEADEMLRMGFVDDVELILGMLNLFLSINLLDHRCKEVLMFKSIILLCHIILICICYSSCLIAY